MEEVSDASLDGLRENIIIFCSNKQHVVQQEY